MVETGAMKAMGCRVRQSFRFVAESRFADHHRVLSLNPGMPAITRVRVQLGITDFIQRKKVKTLLRKCRSNLWLGAVCVLAAVMARGTDSRTSPDRI